MNGLKNTDYLRFLFHRAKTDLTRYELSNSNRELINNLFNRLSYSENLLKDLYILSQIRELHNIGRYFIFILKKIEDNVINFDNFSSNIDTDSRFIEKELLSFFSNPVIKSGSGFDFSKKLNINEEEKADNSGSFSEEAEENYSDQENLADAEEEDFTESEDEEEIEEFKQNYLELIKSVETDGEIVFELPILPGSVIPEQYSDNNDESKAETDTEKSITEDNTAGNGEFDFESGISAEINTEISDGSDSINETSAVTDKEVVNEADAFALPGEEVTEDETDKEFTIKPEEKKAESEITARPAEIRNIVTDFSESSFKIKKVIKSDNEGSGEEKSDNEASEEMETKVSGKRKIADSPEGEEKSGIKVNGSVEEIKSQEENKETNTIKLSQDIQEELNLFEEGKISAEEEETQEADTEELTEEEQEPTNAEFAEYENIIKRKNDELDKEFDIMIYLVNAQPGDEGERYSIIKNIIDTSAYLETVSRKMSLEIISNIYQTFTLSFDKISDGKYDISESTLNLFKKSLTLVISLIRGDDYFGFKDILKSVENIRNSLIEEKQKREIYLKQQKEKQEIDNQINQRFPEESQKAKIAVLKQLIRETETKFKSLEKITGEFQIYEALRSLSGCLTNLKEIVKVSKELNIKKMGQLSESGYIFIKFLQNYRINPVTNEINEILGYLIYNLKSIIMNRHVEDADEFISYLNDPVKIFSKKGKKKS